MSGMAQATAIQALARAADLLDQPRYLKTARRALGAFETLPPTGVRAVGPAGGIHYLQYSFAPRLWIFNAFLQSLIGLYDYSEAHRRRARPRALSRTPSRRRGEELPLSDVGDWSRYNYAGHESSRDYHELLREFLQSMCSRRLGAVYCTYARRYRGYQTDPPVLELNVPELTAEGRPHRDPLQRLEALGGGDHDHQGREGGVPRDRDLPPRGRARSSGGRARAGSTRCGWARRSCAPGAASRTAERAEIEVEPDPEA